jgi:hypothetical protein
MAKLLTASSMNLCRCNDNISVFSNAAPAGMAVVWNDEPVAHTMPHIDEYPEKYGTSQILSFYTAIFDCVWRRVSG